MSRTLTLLFTFFMFTKLLAQPIDSAEAIYVGKDVFNNELVKLSLLKDNQYVYTEKFLDGSELTDVGKWEIKGNVLVLKSSMKANRQHIYLKFEKTYKFRKALFEIVGDSLKFKQDSKSSQNRYLANYAIVRLGS